ncbi:hypothetical protein AZI86_17580 [Bdellovibrio bacteriovorus]|uniref:Bdellovibrio beta-sandwich domain-containing protein n=1 Tax=Bdellovibrio bacteriovorus TaxID=959 RepID=A0A150WER6_BDEBC|nr:beta-sandwich domain-containing protein [Bdellovibrio bacteriovorus]KYG61519.1 hypothetical protein AZI86_17580 [Bdellovibrio bacteriovorus]
MKRSLILILTVSLLLQSTGHADFADLPDPGGDSSSQSGSPGSGQQPAAGEYAGSLTIGGLSRRTGGTVYTARLHKPLPLSRLDVRVTLSKVKFYSVTLITEQGERFLVSEFNNTSVFETGTLVSSKNLGTQNAIASIELVTESYSGEADIILTALSKSEVPKLLLKVEAPKPAPSPVPAPTATPEPSPSPTATPAPNPTPAPTVTPSPSPAPEPDDSYNIRVGDTVLYNSNIVGKVLKVLADDYATVVFADGKREDVDRAFLEKSTRCVGTLCEGKKVYYNGTKAQIINIFSSGWVYLSLRNGQKIVVDMYFVSEQNQGCSKDGICVGDGILYKNRYDGTVVEVLSEERILIRLEGSTATLTVGSNQLAKSLQCTEGSARSCVGEKVLIQGNGATILGIYSNGTAKVRMDNQNRVLWVNHNSLTKNIRCMKNICVGQRVRYGVSSALVLEIYSNGTARVEIGILGKQYLVRVDSLRP